jgi:hypothetical protein
MRPAEVVVIDCDLYVSTVPVLRFIKDRLQPGTVVLFDDWNGWSFSDEMGERRAFHEFLAENPEWTAEPLFDRRHEGGAAFTMRRTDA